MHFCCQLAYVSCCSQFHLKLTFCFISELRPVWEGGHYEGDESKRQNALRLAMELGAHYVDVELQVDTLQM